jgi:drug/metabolite transporter (DMT)-like permease
LACGAPSRISAHIGFLFSAVAGEAHLSFFNARDSIISFFTPGLPLSPPSAASARLELPPSTLAKKQPAARAVPAHADKPFRGIALVLLATVFLGTSDVTSKYLSATLPSIEIAWIRFLVFLLIMAPAVLPGTRFYALPTRRAGLLVVRSTALLASAVFFISGLRFIPIAEASATSFVSPLFVTALSIFLLKESVGLRRWLATAVGLIGVLIVLRPGSSAFHPAALFSVVSAFAWAVTLVLTRMMSGERTPTMMAYAAIVGFAIMSALVPFVWVTPSWHDIFFGIVVGLASTIGQWIVVLAFRYANASVLAPFSYTQLLWVTFLGVLVFGEVPDVWTVSGAAIIVASGLYTAHRERLRRSEVIAQAELSPNP